MVDRLRLLVNRPLHDSDRGRLFAVAVVVIVTVAAVLTLLDDAGPAPEAEGTAKVGRNAGETPTGAATPLPDAPSEEGTPPSADQGTPADIARTKRAARDFLAGYLPFTYGRGHASRLPAATPELRAELAHHAPRVPPRERRRRPRLVLLQTNGVNGERAELVALVRDGRRRYSVPLELANTPAGWLVTGLGS